MFNNPCVIASEAKQSQTMGAIASSLTLLAMTAQLINNLYDGEAILPKAKKDSRIGGEVFLSRKQGVLLPEK